MFLFLFRIIILVGLNFGIFIIVLLKHISITQSINLFFDINMDEKIISYWVISFQFYYDIILVQIFKPFIEIYLLHYSRYLFYLLINLLSLSTIYIVLGYMDT